MSNKISIELKFRRDTSMPRRGEEGGEREGGGRDGENRGIFERNKLKYFGALNFTYFNLPV